MAGRSKEWIMQDEIALSDDAEPPAGSSLVHGNSFTILTDLVGFYFLQLTLASLTAYYWPRTRNQHAQDMLKLRVGCSDKYLLSRLLVHSDMSITWQATRAAVRGRSVSAATVMYDFEQHRTILLL